MTLKFLEDIYMNISVTLGEENDFLSKIPHTQLHKEMLIYLTQN